MTAGTKSLRLSIDEILATSWDRKLAKDLAEEIESCTGDKLGTVFEMRRFLALKGYRELLQLLREARNGKNGDDALAAVAHAMRRYALDRPALSAAAFRTAAVDCPEWREAHERLPVKTAVFRDPAFDARSIPAYSHVPWRRRGGDGSRRRPT